ncbi:MAG: endolytic transglycosylase MltG [Oscillospiraceae bacterium]
MDENRFEEDNSIGKTRELDSILAETESGITPREQFSEENLSDEDLQKTRQMDSLADGSDDFGESAPPAPNPVKRRKKKHRKKPQTNHTRTYGQIFLGVVLSVASIAAGVLLAFKCLTAIKDFTGMAKGAREYEITIDESMSVDSIVKTLHENGIIEMPSLFKAYINLSEKQLEDDEDAVKGFLNGEFTVNSNMSYSSLISAMKTEKTYTETVRIMIPEGYTAQQIGQLLEENCVCRAEDFEVYYKSKLNLYDFEEEIVENPDRFYEMEGYLFPDTYEFFVIDDLKEKKDFDTLEYAKKAANKMYANFESKITKAMKARMKELGLTLDETIILASLIQKEGIGAEDMAMISSVFHNRLAEPDRFPQLQSDTTDTYIDDCIRPTIPTNAGDLYDSIIAAYDTYSCEGLPAGAVCNPGLEAINAALYPAETDYYYFLASDDGVFYFASTVEQHEQNIKDAALRDED